MLLTELLTIRKEYNFRKRELYFILDYLIDHPAILNNAIITETPILPRLTIQEAVPQIVFETENEIITEDIRMIWQLQRHFNQPFYLVINKTLSFEEKAQLINHLYHQIDEAIDAGNEVLFNQLSDEIKKLNQ